MVINKIHKYVFPDSVSELQGSSVRCQEGSVWFYVTTDNGVMYGTTAGNGLKTIIRDTIPGWALIQSKESNILEMLVLSGITEQDIQTAEQYLKNDGDRIIIDKDKVTKMWDTDELTQL